MVVVCCPAYCSINTYKAEVRGYYYDEYFLRFPSLFVEVETFYEFFPFRYAITNLLVHVASV